MLEKSILFVFEMIVQLAIYCAILAVFTRVWWLPYLIVLLVLVGDLTVFASAWNLLNSKFASYDGQILSFWMVIQSITIVVLVLTMCFVNSILSGVLMAVVGITLFAFRASFAVEIA